MLTRGGKVIKQTKFTANLRFRINLQLHGKYLVNTMVGVTARLVYVAMKDHDLDDHVTEGE